jgi:hypothetical protein
MSTPYRSTGCAACGAALPSGSPENLEGASSQGSALCERCVLEAITNTRRLLERLEASPASRPPRFALGRCVTGLLPFLIAGLVVAPLLLWGYQSSRSHALAQMQTVSPGDAAYNRAPRPREPAASSPAAWSGSSRISPSPGRPYAHASDALPWPPAILATAEKGVTHDPQELFARAERLAQGGADLTLRETRLSSASLPLGGSNGLGTVLREGRPIGVNVSQPGPLLASAGVERGDVVTSVNGYGYPEDPQRWVEPFLQPSGSAVIEVLRGARRVVLSVRWREPLVK